MKILVTGGAGYIGGITATLLCDQEHEVYVLDNLSTGFLVSVPKAAQFVEGDILNQELVEKVLGTNQIEAVIHFAAKLIVPESVEKPFEYYENNVVGGLRLLEACRKTGVKKIIFSSTAAVYGDPETMPVVETAPVAPLNPYGASKAMVEQFLRDYEKAYGLKYVVLRYFNVAGAMEDLSRGQRTKNATHLIKVASETAAGKRPTMYIHGTDYKTPDGTGVRDYIHVVDLAQAHLDALAYLNKGGASEVMNCGYDHGFSVREVIEKVKSVSQNNFKVIEGPRREGDAETIVADSSKARRLLGWRPKYDNLEFICRTAYEWERKL
jgi:UDP-glucose 4-epimerase